MESRRNIVNVRLAISGTACQITLLLILRQNVKRKLARTALIAAALMLPTAAANAVVLDLHTMTCKQFVESDKDTISMMLTWLDGGYKGDSDEAKIDRRIRRECQEDRRLLRREPDHQHCQRCGKGARGQVRLPVALAKAGIHGSGADVACTAISRKDIEANRFIRVTAYGSRVSGGQPA